MTAAKKEKPHYLGHRQRLREKFLGSGQDNFADYELLELLLYGAIPRGDTKPLAKDLLKRFDSLAGVLAATPRELATVKGIGESSVAAIKIAQACTQRILRQQVINRPILSSWQAVLDYCHAMMAFVKTEQVRLLFLDNKNHLIADELQSSGTVDQAPLYAREVVKRALELHASAVIMVHNHPTGDPSPSKEDISVTKAVQKALAAVQINLHDHLIIGSTGHKSLKALQII